jgi:hypothetical protein
MGGFHMQRLLLPGRTPMPQQQDVDDLQFTQMQNWLTQVGISWFWMTAFTTTSTVTESQQHTEAIHNPVLDSLQDTALLLQGTAPDSLVITVEDKDPST